MDCVNVHFEEFQKFHTFCFPNTAVDKARRTYKTPQCCRKLGWQLDWLPTCVIDRADSPTTILRNSGASYPQSKAPKNHKPCHPKFLKVTHIYLDQGVLKSDCKQVDFTCRQSNSLRKSVTVSLKMAQHLTRACLDFLRTGPRSYRLHSWTPAVPGLLILLRVFLRPILGEL